VTDDLDQRQPRERHSAYMGWISKLCCIACMCEGKYQRGVHVAHLRSGSIDHGKRATGMAEKPSDVWTTPLCPAHHVNGPKSQHHRGDEAAWWEELGVNPFDLCIALQEAFAAGKNGRAVIAHFAAKSRKT
jgi:hypothetical protein